MLISSQMKTIAWFAPDLVSKTESGTARLANKLIANSKFDFKHVLILTDKSQINVIQNNSIYSKLNYILLPNVRFNFLRRSRQFYKYCFKNFKSAKYDYTIFHVPRFYPFYWLFPSKKFACIFHAGGEITAKSDKFVLSRFIYVLIAKFQWSHLDRIIAVSKSAALEISTHYKIPLSKIQTIRLGVDHIWIDDFKPNAISKKSILIVGRWVKFKNIPFVLNSIENNFDKIKGLCDFTLLCNLDNNTENELRIKYPKLNINFLKNVSDKELQNLYFNSHVLIFPSLNEGFGFPAFEGFSEGCNLLIHEDTPAAELLFDQEGVFPTNMLDEDDFMENFLDCLNSTKIDYRKRRQIISQLGLIWNNTYNDFYQLF